MTSNPPVARPTPAPTRHERAKAPERYYVGRRRERTEVYVVSGTELKPLAHLSYQSDATFDWGRLTEGASELAFAMLVHSTESRPPDLICQAFCREVVACLDPAGFVLSRGDIALWLMTAFCGDDGSPDEPGPDRPIGLGRRAADWIRSRLRRT
ncbi:MAG: DUF6166 domain-containing protein [Solirubrobacteraceae bacterium]